MSLAVQGLTVRHGSRTVIDAITFDLEKPGVYGLVGPNGAGKSTLIKAVGGVLPYSGEVRVDGADVQDLTCAQRARKIAYVAQNTSVTTTMSVAEVVALGRSVPRGLFRSSNADAALVRHCLERVDAYDLATRPITELSGGQVQRVMVARALAQQAGILLCDEPTSSLDLRHQFELLDLLREVAECNGTVVLIALHALDLAARYCDWVTVLDGGGGIAAAGSPREVLTTTVLETVFGVHARFVESADGYPLVDILGPVNRARTGERDAQPE